MAQKHNQIVFAEYNLGLNNSSNNYKVDGLANEILNIQCKNGEIKSAEQFADLFEIIEPSRAAATAEAFLNNVKTCKWVTDYCFFNGTEEITYIVFCNQENKIFYYKLNSANPQFICLNNMLFTSVPKYEYFIKDNQNIMIFCSTTDNMWVWDGINEPYQVLDAPKVTSMAVGLDRLFVTCDSHPYSVLFSDDLDPSNWSIMSGEAGEVEFHDNLGKVLMVFALDNYIFVIREHGIVKLYGYKETSNTFNTSRVYTVTSKIYKNSVAICGDKIIFMCNDGIYSFDGLNGKKIYNQLNGLIFNTKNTCAVCVDNTYYLCTNMYKELSYNNVLICIDLSSQNITNICSGHIYTNVCMLNINNASMLVVLTKDLLSKNANLPQYLCKNTTKTANSRDFLYKTNFLNPYPQSSNKVLTKLTFLCKTDTTICIITDTQTKEYKINGSNNFQTLKLNLKANIFAIQVSGVCDVDISHIKLDYSFVE